MRTDHRPLVWAPRQARGRTRHQGFSQEAATRTSTLQLHPGPEVRSGQFTGEPGGMSREGRKGVHGSSRVRKGEAQGLPRNVDHSGSPGRRAVVEPLMPPSAPASPTPPSAGVRQCLKPGLRSTHPPEAWLPPGWHLGSRVPACPGPLGCETSRACSSVAGPRTQAGILRTSAPRAPQPGPQRCPPVSSGCTQPGLSHSHGPSAPAQAALTGEVHSNRGCLREGLDKQSQSQARRCRPL